MSTHTPGPWVAAENSVSTPEVACIDVHAADPSHRIAYVQSYIDEEYGGQYDYPRDQAMADARLIAAAPRMLGELKAAPSPNGLDFTNPERFTRIYREWYEQRSAAIAEAEGGA